jgi:tripartite-type tricarboxylate transporter receptor subunit TctC
MSQWYGLNVPASMPAAAIDRLAAAAAKAMKEPTTLERLAHDAAIAVGSTPAEYAAFITAEQKRWQPVIARAKIKPD